MIIFFRVLAIITYFLFVCFIGIDQFISCGFLFRTSFWPPAWWETPRCWSFFCRNAPRLWVYSLIFSNFRILLSFSCPIHIHPILEIRSFSEAQQFLLVPAIFCCSSLERNTSAEARLRSWRRRKLAAWTMAEALLVTCNKNVSCHFALSDPCVNFPSLRWDD